jgi:NAD-dependent SIR2 family protein deacetylase
MDQKTSERVDLLEQWIKESDNVVFFGGAGVSTESGIPDFRSVDGLYNQQYDYPPETIISAICFSLICIFPFSCLLHIFMRKLRLQYQLLYHTYQENLWNFLFCFTGRTSYEQEKESTFR